MLWCRWLDDGSQWRGLDESRRWLNDGCHLMGAVVGFMMGANDVGLMAMVGGDGDECDNG